MGVSLTNWMVNKTGIDMKIAVYGISKNEDKFIKTFCESAKDADLILIADTGSTDDTVALGKQCGAEVRDICITPWRFDKARDAALAMLPKDIDICISLDLDEKLTEGWREEIERVWTKDTTRLRYKFDWGSGIVFYSEKIHARTGYYWKHPCHEYITLDPRTKEVWAHTDKLLITHHPDPTKSRGSYMSLLQVAIDEDRNCPRNAFYYARELSFNYRWQEAIIALNRYLALPDAKWEHERCYAMRLLGKCHEGLKKDGLPWYRRAVAEASETREPWVDLASATYRRGLWPECYSAAMSAIAITHKPMVYTTDAAAWGSLPYDLASVAAWQLGMKTQAIEMCKKAIGWNPDDSRLRKNLAAMIEQIPEPLSAQQ